MLAKLAKRELKFVESMAIQADEGAGGVSDPPISRVDYGLACACFVYFRDIPFCFTTLLLTYPLVTCITSTALQCSGESWQTKLFPPNSALFRRSQSPGSFPRLGRCPASSDELASHAIFPREKGSSNSRRTRGY